MILQEVSDMELFLDDVGMKKSMDIFMDENTIDDEERAAIWEKCVIKVRKTLGPYYLNFINIKRFDRLIRLEISRHVLKYYVEDFKGGMRPA